MEKLVAILCLSALTTGAFAQGLVNFANNDSTLSEVTINGVSSPTSGPPGSWYYGLLISSSGSFTFAGAYATNQTTAGRFRGGVVAATGWAPGATMAYEVAVWSASLGPTFNNAWLNGAFTTPGYFGLSSVATGMSGGGFSPAYNLFGGTGLQGNFSAQPVHVLLVPTITWTSPADIVYGTPLSGTQLNATAASPTTPGVNLPGTFIYNPPLGTVLYAGSQMLGVTFVPADTTTFATVMTNVVINVRTAPLIATASSGNKTYGQTVTFAGTEFSTSGLVNGDTVTGATLSSPGAAATATVTGSPYAITASAAVGTGLANYNISYQPGTLTVNPAALKIAANAQSKPYGQALNLGTTAFTPSGLANADTVTGVTLTSPGAAPTATVAGSPYAITAGTAVGTGLGNYNITYQTGTLTVNPAALAVTAGAQSKTYGQALNLGTTAFTPSGLANADTVKGATLSSPGAAATATVTGSPYAITASAAVGTGLANYNISYHTGSLTVNPAALAITASAQSKTYGQALNLGTTAFLTGGLANADMVTGVMLTSPGTAATATVAGSPYAITAGTAAGTGLGNYNITYQPGTLMVNPAALTVTANDTNRAYGGTNPVFTGTLVGVTNNDNITAQYTCSATDNTPPGKYVIVPILIDPGSKLGNYLVTTNNGTLTIYVALSGSLQVTISPAGAITAGAQWQVDGGTLQSSGTTVSGLQVGSHTVSFNTISGWTTPANQNVSVSGNSTATATGTYVAQTGSLQVTIGPAGAITAGAQWQVDGGALQSSGATVSGLPVGSHTVGFSTISGWTTPANQNVSVSANLTALATGTYVVQTGSLQVTISPAAAITAGAQWQVDGGTLQSSGATVSGLPVGSHTVSFSTISGWSTPANQNVSVSANSSATATGTYVAQTAAHFWLYQTVNNNYVFEKIDPASGAVLQTITAIGWPTHPINGGGFAYANGYFWLYETVNNNYVFEEIDPASGAVVQTITAIGWPTHPINGGGFAYANGYFWLYETVNNNYVFEKIDPTSGAVVQTITAIGWPTHPINGGGFAYANGYFWLYETVNNNYVFEEIDPASGAVVQTITAIGWPTHPINGGDFAYANGYFWLYETVNNNYVFEEIDPTSGAVVQTITAIGWPTHPINGGDFAYEQQLSVSTSSSPGAGTVMITFTGTLTSSSTVNGTYTPVAGATSPYTVPSPTGAQFYRTHN